jgi:hypothetical protein
LIRLRRPSKWPRKRPGHFGLRFTSALCALVGVTALLSTDLAPGQEAWWSPLGRPEPLAAIEEHSPAAQALARRFNPAMALSDGGIWPIEVRYTWADGADLKAQVLGPRDKVVREYVAVPNAQLERRPWTDLPNVDAEGHRIRYTIDAPGDDRPQADRITWRQRWDALVGNDPRRPAGSYLPTQYAHLFWYNRAEGLLGIQYWFFYPFNEWINRHEGDWEHVNVILQGPRELPVDQDLDPLAFQPVGYQFAFHNWRYETTNVVRVGGPAPGEDHVVVFVGGKSRFLWWSGTTSGGSYPLPAFFSGAGDGPVKPDEDTRAPQRFINATDFQVVQLPEPERLDARAHPELSWLALEFYAGQQHVFSNPFLIDWLGYGGPVLQPARRTAWNARRGKPRFTGGAVGTVVGLHFPRDWSLLAAPWLHLPRK